MVNSFETMKQCKAMHMCSDPPFLKGSLGYALRDAALLYGSGSVTQSPSTLLQSCMLLGSRVAA